MTFGELPFPPGESPFHMKGLGYRTTVSWVRDHLRAKGRNLGTVFDDPALVSFFEQPFLASAWYDVFPILRLVETGAGLAGTDVRDFVRDLTAIQARSDIKGVYRFLLSVISPAAVAKRLPRLTRQYFDFGDVDEEPAPGPDRVRMVRRQMPEALVGWYEHAAAGYVDQVLQLAGASAAHSTLVATWPDAALHGIPTTAMRFEFAWQG